MLKGDEDVIRNVFSQGFVAVMCLASPLLLVNAVRFYCLKAKLLQA